MRDEDAEKMIEDFIRRPETYVSQWMNNSGQGDPELSRKDGSGEGEADNIGEGDDGGESDDSYEGEADGSGRNLEIRNSGEVHIYMLSNEASVVYIHVLTLFLILAIRI